uniref:Uncharacterized protein n=1 Tax=viral metagenome TaxID=1070528 RepID=A0A6C0KHG1_9ZZZZ
MPFGLSILHQKLHKPRDLSYSNVDKGYKQKCGLISNMNGFFIFALLALSVTALRPKFCYNCQHFLSAENGEAKFGKCAQFPIVIQHDDFLVTGETNSQTTDHKYCSSARHFEKMCGQEGKLHKRRYRKNQHKK